MKPSMELLLIGTAHATYPIVRFSLADRVMVAPQQHVDLPIPSFVPVR
jgi:hypothetical protein